MDFSAEMFEADAAGTDFNPDALTDVKPPAESEEPVEGFRAPGDGATTAELLKFLIDRTGYIKQLEAEDTPDSLARIDNLRELVNAAMDSRDRGETLNEFLDHAALVSDADQYDENSRITLMTLHAAKGLEFPLVILAGMEEGLFPHSRTLMAPDDIEEERRLCYVGMTRAMDTLIVTQRALSATLRHRHARGEHSLALPRRDSAGLVAGLGNGAALHLREWRRIRDRRITRTKTRTSGRNTDSQNPSRGLRSTDRRTTRSTTLRSSLRRAERSFRCRKPHRQSRPGRVRIPSGTARATPQIWRRNGVPARRRRGKREDYGTIS